MVAAADGFDRLYETARALGEDTRFRIYRSVCGAASPVSVSALAQAFSLHPNAVRQHLARLEHAGLVVSTPHRRVAGAGRPARLYAPSPEPAELASPPRGSRALVALLAEAVDTLPATDEPRLAAFARRWGKAWASQRKRGTGATPRSRRGRAALLQSELAEWGWRPVSETSRGGIKVATGRCLFTAAAPGVNGRCCALEEGLLNGLVDTLVGGHAEVVRTIGCRLEVRL